MNLTFFDRLFQGFKSITVCYSSDVFKIYLKDVIRIDVIDYWELSVGFNLETGKYIKLTTNKATYILSKEQEDNYLHISKEDFDYLWGVYIGKCIRQSITRD